MQGGQHHAGGIKGASYASAVGDRLQRWRRAPAGVPHPRPTLPHSRAARPAQEDARLQELVHRYGTANWPDVAAEMPGRTSKSCSLRCA